MLGQTRKLFPGETERQTDELPRAAAVALDPESEPGA